jgi:hypothetical protein
MSLEDHVLKHVLARQPPDPLVPLSEPPSWAFGPAQQTPPRLDTTLLDAARRSASTSIRPSAESSMTVSRPVASRAAIQQRQQSAQRHFPKPYDAPAGIVRARVKRASIPDEISLNIIIRLFPFKPPPEVSSAVH